MTDYNDTTSPPIKPEVPEFLRIKWQKLADILAKSSEFPAALIMHIDPPEIEVFVSSHSDGNPYEAGERANLDTGLYCETVMATHTQLYVPDALKDADWDHNPDIKLGMICYLGIPIEWPNGEIFGTLCILDKKNNPDARENMELMDLLREVIQLDLKNLVEAEHARKSESLRYILEQKKYEGYFRASPYAMLIYDIAGFVDCNPAALKVLQINQKSELIGLTALSFLPDLQPDGRRSIDVLAEAQKQAIEKGQHVEEMTLQNRGKETFTAQMGISRMNIMHFELLLFTILKSSD